MNTLNTVAVEIKASTPEQKKYLDMIQGVEQMGKYRYRYTVAEDFCIDVTICTHDLKDKNDLMHHWKEAGYVSEVSETHLALDCYYTDLEGNCWGRYTLLSRRENSILNGFCRIRLKMLKSCLQKQLSGMLRIQNCALLT